ncbi:MAG: PilT/PilU family type 4a pilus ATPase [Candidatus Omnitrophica bacterium]|nr:PilT/PilU family type 4a pilus ATPase [Candidatus Omnitrophota bacterium]
MDIRRLLKDMVKKGASDMHLKVGSVPFLRINKELTAQKTHAPLTADEMAMIISDLATEDQRRLFDKNNEIDFAYLGKDIGRFRVNIFRQRGEAGIVMRHVKDTIPTFKKLNLPAVFEKIAGIDRGIILVTGASSSGKSTTLASIIDHINSHKNKHIVTLENPIEFIYRDKMAVINQREIGVDTESFHAALRQVIRQDPDVIVIGEMRDTESVRVSISAAETGHLVLSSFHADDTVQAISRLIDFFKDSEKNQIRMQLADNLRAITSQRLLKMAGAKESDAVRLVPATEVLIMNPIVSKIIKDNRMNDIYKVLQTGDDRMCSFNMSLASLFKNKKVTQEEALSKSSNPGALKINLKGIYLDEDRGILGS